MMPGRDRLHTEYPYSMFGMELVNLLYGCDCDERRPISRRRLRHLFNDSMLIEGEDVEWVRPSAPVSTVRRWRRACAHFAQRRRGRRDPVAAQGMPISSRKTGPAIL
jgi:hypothetical protein